MKRPDFKDLFYGSNSGKARILAGGLEFFFSVYFLFGPIF